MSERVVVDLEIAAPAERVWQALRDKDEVLRWFGWEYDGLDAEVDEIFFTGAQADYAARTLDTGDGVYTVRDAGGGARVVVTRTTPPSRDPDPIDAGWQQFTAQLRTYVEEGAVERPKGA